MNPINDNNVVPLFAVPLCKTKIDPITEEEMTYLTTEIPYLQLWAATTNHTRAVCTAKS